MQEKSKKQILEISDFGVNNFALYSKGIDITKRQIFEFVMRQEINSPIYPDDLKFICNNRTARNLLNNLADRGIIVKISNYPNFYRREK